jgi:hypothetical protein
MGIPSVLQKGAKMKSIPGEIVRFLKRKLWALIVAYMIGMHNFYTGENKTADNIGIIVEYHENINNEGSND